MQTINDRLTAYCQKTGEPPLWGRHKRLLSATIIQLLKNQGKYEGVAKVTITEEMQVNAYPDDTLETIDSAIDRYYSDRPGFFALCKSTKPSWSERSFPYEVPHFKASAFEKALTATGFPVQRSVGFDSETGLVQYIIPMLGPSKLINLGKRFGKERAIEKRQRYQANRLLSAIPLEDSSGFIIMEYHFNGTIYNRQKDPENFQKALDNDAVIFSVRRLSDGQHFAGGHFTNKGIIQGFTLINGVLVVTCSVKDKDRRCSLSTLEHVKPIDQ